MIKLGGWKDREGRRRKLINIWSSWLWPYGSCCPDKEIKNRGVRLQLSGQFRQLKSTSSKLVANTKTPSNNYCYAGIKDCKCYRRERKEETSRLFSQVQKFLNTQVISIFQKHSSCMLPQFRVAGYLTTKRSESLHNKHGSARTVLFKSTFVSISPKIPIKST